MRPRWGQVSAATTLVVAVLAVLVFLVSRDWQHVILAALGAIGFVAVVAVVHGLHIHLVDTGLTRIGYRVRLALGSAKRRLTRVEVRRRAQGSALAFDLGSLADEIAEFRAARGDERLREDEVLAFCRETHELYDRDLCKKAVALCGRVVAFGAAVGADCEKVYRLDRAVRVLRDFAERVRQDDGGQR